MSVCSFQEMLKNVTNRHHNRIKKFCAPLDAFNVNNFWYYNINDKGQFRHLASNPEYNEFFFTELYHTYPYFRQPKLIHSHISFLHCIRENEWQASLQKARDKYNIQTSLQITNRTAEGIEVYGFSLGTGNELQQMLLINELHTLGLFFKKFRQECGFLFNLLEEYPVDLTATPGISFYQNDVSFIPPSFARSNFLKQIGIDIPEFSARQKEIMYHLIRGDSANKIAQTLMLSKRTIENYVETIKNKLGCFSKAELIKKLLEIESIAFDS